MTFIATNSHVDEQNILIYLVVAHVSRSNKKRKRVHEKRGSWNRFWRKYRIVSNIIRNSWKSLRHLVSNVLNVLKILKVNRHWDKLDARTRTFKIHHINTRHSVRLAHSSTPSVFTKISTIFMEIYYSKYTCETEMIKHERKEKRQRKYIVEDFWYFYSKENTVELFYHFRVFSHK